MSKAIIQLPTQHSSGLKASMVNAAEFDVTDLGNDRVAVAPREGAGAVRDFFNVRRVATAQTDISGDEPWAFLAVRPPFAQPGVQIPPAMMGKFQQLSASPELAALRERLGVEASLTDVERLPDLFRRELPALFKHYPDGSRLRADGRRRRPLRADLVTTECERRSRPCDHPVSMPEDGVPLEDQVVGVERLNFDDLTDLQVFGRWAEVMQELAARGLIWSGKSPLADYAELLVARSFNVEPLKGTNPGYDLVTEAGRRVQVKSRRYGPGSKPGHLGEFAEFFDERFDDLVVVLFEADFTVRSAYLAPYAWVAKRVKPVKDKHRLTIKAVLDDVSNLTELTLDQS